MARIAFRESADYSFALEKLSDAMSRNAIIDSAIADGAAIVADAIRANLDAIPTEEYRHLQPGEVFVGLPEGQKRDISEGFGLTPIQTDKNGYRHTKAGFDGYGSYPTKRYPNGIPNQLIARSVESGSSVREKHPFVRPAVDRTRSRAQKAMDAKLQAEIEKIMK